MSKVFYNSISELGNAFGVNLELPEHINSDTQWLCYVATCRIGLEYISFLCEYKIVDGELYFFRKEKGWFHEESSIHNEKKLYANDVVYHNDSKYRYVRVNNQVLKGISDELLGCEFWKQSTGGGNIVKYIFGCWGGIEITSQYGFSTPLGDAKFYLNDFDNSLVGYDEFVSETYLND